MCGRRHGAGDHHRAGLSEGEKASPRDGGKARGSVIDTGNPSVAELRRGVSLKLAITARQMRRHFDHVVAERGITRSQWVVITAVARAQGATQRTLAHILEMSEASAGRLVDRLCAEGLVERRPKEDDRRAHCVFLTPAGDSLIADLAQVATAHETTTFAGIGEDDLARIEELLERILNNLGRPTEVSLEQDAARAAKRRPA